MKRTLLIPVVLTLAIALSPLSSFAGDEVTINNSVSLSVNSATLVVTSGARINQIVVSDTSFSTTMTGTSTIKVTSAARRTLTVSPSNMASNATCNSNESSVTIGASSTGNPVVVTVDVSSDTCGSGSGGSGSSGGGSVVGVTTGGGGSSSPAPTPAPLPATADQAQKIIAAAKAALGTPSSGAVGATFTKNLGPGVTSPDVKRLQQLLNMSSDTKIADTGVGSPGNESGFYGALTITAVQKFQKKYGLISEGTPSTTGYGALGPKTRAAIEMYLGGSIAPKGAEGTAMSTPAPAAAPTPVSTGSAPMVHLTNMLSKGKTHSDVKALQQVLNSDPDTMITSTGVGSVGNETDFFGAMTEKAVQKFQMKHGIATEKDTGFGAVGPKTRAKINELFGQKGSMSGETMMSTPAPTSVPAASTDAQKAAIQKQIEDAMKKIQEISGQLKTGS